MNGKCGHSSRTNVVFCTEKAHLSFLAFSGNRILHALTKRSKKDKF